jgi:hypothetical protein
MSQWDPKKSYNKGEQATFQNVEYIYVNPNNPSVAGQKPTSANYPLTYEGETRSVRSWIPFDYIIPSSPLNALPDDIRRVRGVEGDSALASTSYNPGNNFVFDFNKTHTPYRTRTDLAQFLGEQANISWVEKQFPQNFYVDDNCGFNLEFKTQITYKGNQGYSFNISEHNLILSNTFPESERISIGFEYRTIPRDGKKFIQGSAYVKWSEQIAFLLKNRNVSTFIALYNCAGKKVKFAYMPVFLTPNDGWVEQSVEYLTVSTGPFGDKLLSGSFIEGQNIAEKGYPLDDSVLDVKFYVNRTDKIDTPEGFIEAEIVQIDPFDENESD